MSMGIWVCSWCHRFCEGVEHNYYPKYIALKKQVEIEMPLHMERTKKVFKKDQIIELLKQGKTNIEIARTLNVSNDHVCHTRAINNLPRNYKWNEEKKQFLIENYHKMRAKEIAEQLGFTVFAVYQKYKKMKQI
jgi:hypothetical protein